MMDLEKSFNRAIEHSFSLNRFLMTFLVLVVCGLLFVFCQSLTYHASPWLCLALRFLPIFLISGLLLALGVILTKMYTFQLQNMGVNLRRLLQSSMDLIIGISYLSLPPLLVFIVCWMFLGLFFLFKEIPGIGEFLSVIFSFGPFLLIFISFLLILVNVLLLFFIAPAATILSLRKGMVAKKVWEITRNRILSSAKLFFVGTLPLLILFALLYFSLVLTNTCFFVSQNSFLRAMELFFLMIPFAALISPAVVFFFNFAAESHLLLQRKER
jgi:hypothetical protein